MALPLFGQSSKHGLLTRGSMVAVLRSFDFSKAFRLAAMRIQGIHACAPQNVRPAKLPVLFLRAQRALPKYVWPGTWLIFSFL